MSKYKVGDKFEIEVTGETGIARDYYYVTTVGIVNEEALDRLKRIEPVESEVDWSKVPVDTPILVRDHRGEEWIRAHFAEYSDDRVYAWINGLTSWTTAGCKLVWTYAKLAEDARK